MSDSADSTNGSGSDESSRSERERIRERKRRELREELGGDDETSTDGTAGDGTDGTGTDGTEADETGSDPTPAEPIEVESPAAFQRVVTDHDVVLVDCYADWCGPCQMMEPTIEALASDTDAVVAKVDVDANPEIAQQLGARSIPTLLLYADGEPVDRFVGAQDRATLEAAIESNAA